MRTERKKGRGGEKKTREEGRKEEGATSVSSALIFTDSDV